MIKVNKNKNVLFEISLNNDIAIIYKTLMQIANNPLFRYRISKGFR